MSELARRTGRLSTVGVIAAALLASGCAHVKQDELDSRLDQIRQEMQDGDRQNATRIDEVDGRVDDLSSRIDALERDLRSLGDEFDVTVERLESALRFNTPIHFAYDEAEIRDRDTGLLDRFASVVEDYYSSATITVEGFTDPAGSQEYNLRLGQRRADAVKAYLSESAGLDAGRLKAVSYGENTDRLVNPGAQGPGAAGMVNRRVVLVVDFLPTSGGVRATSEERESGS